MARKKWIWLLAAGIVIVGFIISSILSNQKQSIKRTKNGPGRKAFETIRVENRTVDLPVTLSGYVYAYDKIELYAEVSGVLLTTKKPFREGVGFQKGEILIHIDDRVYRNTLMAQKSSLLNQLTLLLPDLLIDFPRSAQAWQDYLDQFKLTAPLAPLPQPASEKETYYIASRNIYSQFFTIKGMEETLAKYTLEAPNDGIVTRASINPGTLVRVGQKLGEFTSTALYELEAAVGLAELDRIKPGQTVHFVNESGTEPFTGRIQRINRIVDRTTMTVPVYVHLRNPRLREGMYLTGATTNTSVENVFPLPRRLLIDGTFVYSVDGSTLTRSPVTVVAEQDDTVLIRGLPDNLVLLAEILPDAYDGMPIPGGSDTDLPAANMTRGSDQNGDSRQ